MHDQTSKSQQRQQHIESAWHPGNLETRRDLGTNTFSCQLDRLVGVTSHGKPSTLTAGTILLLTLLLGLQPIYTGPSTVRTTDHVSAIEPTGCWLLQQKCGTCIATFLGYWLFHFKRRKCRPRPKSTLFGRARS